MEEKEKLLLDALLTSPLFRATQEAYQSGRISAGTQSLICQSIAQDIADRMFRSMIDLMNSTEGTCRLG